MNAPAGLPIWAEITLPIGALIVGYLLRMVSEWLADQRASDREAVARNAARQVAREDRERDSLLQLAGALAEFEGLIGRLFMSRFSDYHRTGTWPNIRREYTDDEFQALASRIAIIQVQLADNRYSTSLMGMELHKLSLDAAESEEAADLDRGEALDAIRKTQILLKERYSELESLGSRG
jgi:hypothetical protein